VADADVTTGYDHAAQQRDWKLQDEAQFVAALAAPNPHRADMNLADGLEEDGGMES
jgi:hypothetical protein